MNETKYKLYLEIGGTEWKGKRIYFNGKALEKLYGLKVDRYGGGETGSIKKVMDKEGDIISNSDGWKALMSKLYYDIEKDIVVGAVRETI